MTCERRDRLDTVIQDIEEAGRLLRADSSAWGPITQVIRAIQMEQNTDWQKKYFTEDQLRTMEQLRKASYSEAAEERLASLHPGAWTEEDQKRVDAQYDALHSGVRRLVAEGTDPGSPEAQALAEQQIGLLNEFTRGDAEATAALGNWWENYRHFQPSRSHSRHHSVMKRTRSSIRPSASIETARLSDSAGKRHRQGRHDITTPLASGLGPGGRSGTAHGYA